jgi:hypothetical protein
MATRIKATQCPKQYPHEKSPPSRGLFACNHFRNGSNNLVSVTEKAIHAVTTDNRMTCFISLKCYDPLQQPEEQRATGRSMNFLVQGLTGFLILKHFTFFHVLPFNPGSNLSLRDLR